MELKEALGVLEKQAQYAQSRVLWCIAHQEDEGNLLLWATAQKLYQLAVDMLREKVGLPDVLTFLHNQARWSASQVMWCSTHGAHEDQVRDYAKERDAYRVVLKALEERMKWDT